MTSFQRLVATATFLNNTFPIKRQQQRNATIQQTVASMETQLDRKQQKIVSLETELEKPIDCGNGTMRNSNSADNRKFADGVRMERHMLG